MCGRFTNSADIASQERFFQARSNKLAWQANYNICPTNDVPVLLGDQQRGRRLGLMRWGWNPPVLKGRLLINCRAEELTHKPMFRDDLHHRCIIPATGFYEWKRNEKQKIPHYAWQQHNPIVAFAGIWSKEGACLICTVPANEQLSSVHHRMPLTLAPASFDTWLEPRNPFPNIQKLHTTDHLWSLGVVSSAVNKTSNNGPELCVPTE